MKNKKYISAAIAVVAFAGVAVAAPALAATNPGGPMVQVGAQVGAYPHQGGPRNGTMVRGGGMRPGIFGTVASVSGTSLTVTGRQGFGTTTPTATFTVDASNATVKKNNATSTVSSIAVGDTVSVQGTVTGTNIVATMIRDGVVPMRGGPGKGPQGGQWNQASTSPITGNGQPIVAGSITAINGTSLTITNKSNVQYTIDASNATIAKGGSTATLSNVAVGDNVVVQGTVNGTSVTATSVLDQGASTSTTGSAPAHTSFLGGIGQFFMHLFGF
jgi:hypothetical protein